jgi:ethanolamine-phosphate phospho-lyase
MCLPPLPPARGRRQVTYLTNSGSEANDLALRISRAAAVAAGRLRATHVAVVGGAYHGHLTSTMAIRCGSGGAYRGRSCRLTFPPAPDT